jgi:hypothetical protein
VAATVELAQAEIGDFSPKAWFYQEEETIGTLSLVFRYGENSGDPTHAELHFSTSCYYQIFL